MTCTRTTQRRILAVLLLAAVLMLKVGCGPRTVVRTITVMVTSAPTDPPPLPTATPGPTVVTVCAVGCDFTTIQAAVDDANTIAGGIVTVTDPIHTEAEIIVSKDIIIQGQGADQTTVQAHEALEEATDRVFFIMEGATVTIRNVTIRHGNPDLEPLIPGIRRSGGGIVNQGTLTLEDCVVRDNVASAGAGIHNMGTLTVVNSTVSYNFADGIDKPGQGCGSGGGIMHLREGVVMVINSTISDNRGTGKGGGIKDSCAGTMTLINSTVSRNSTTGNGGGIYVRGTTNLAHCTISGNSARTGGGGVYILGTLNFTNTIIADSITGVDCAIGSGDRIQGVIGSNTNNLVADGGCNSAFSGDPRLDVLAVDEGNTLIHALLPGSPAIDAVPAGECIAVSDQRGVSRPQGTACDIGAFELQSNE